MQSRTEPLVLLTVALAATALSGIGPYERGTWLLEVGPVLVGAPILVLTKRRFPMTVRSQDKIRRHFRLPVLRTGSRKCRRILSWLRTRTRTP